MTTMAMLIIHTSWFMPQIASPGRPARKEAMQLFALDAQ